MRPDDEALRGSGAPESPPDGTAPAEPWPELLSEGTARATQAGSTAPALPDPRVAEVLQQVRSGVRQRAAEAETAGVAGSSGSDTTRQGLLALRQHEFVAEPVPFSHRASLGRAIVFVRKAVY